MRNGFATRPEIQSTRKQAKLDGAPGIELNTPVAVNAIDVEPKLPYKMTCPDCSGSSRRNSCRVLCRILGGLLLLGGIIGLSYITKDEREACPKVKPELGDPCSPAGATCVFETYTCVDGTQIDVTGGECTDSHDWAIWMADVPMDCLTPSPEPVSFSNGSLAEDEYCDNYYYQLCDPDADDDCKSGYICVVANNCVASQCTCLSGNISCTKDCVEAGKCQPEQPEPEPEPEPEPVFSKGNPGVALVSRDGVPNMITIRLTYRLNDEQLNVNSLTGTTKFPMKFPPALNVAAPFGSNIGELAATFFAINSESEFDSWLTIDGFDEFDIEHSNIDFDSWNQTNGIDSKGASITLLNKTIQMTTNPIVIAQLTLSAADATNGSAQAILQGLSKGNASDWIDYVTWRWSEKEEGEEEVPEPEEEVPARCGDGIVQAGETCDDGAGGGTVSVADACQDFYGCIVDCNGDQACQQRCQMDADPAAVAAFSAIQQCIQDEGCVDFSNNLDQDCLNNQCGDQLRACGI